jgi:hypothetical protein
MKIHQLLLPNIGVVVTNEEQHFIENHDQQVKITSLNDHDQRTAQTLVRKGVYTISKDSNTLIKNLHETNN